MGFEAAVGAEEVAAVDGVGAAAVEAAEGAVVAAAEGTVAVEEAAAAAAAAAPGGGADAAAGVAIGFAVEVAVEVAAEGADVLTVAAAFTPVEFDAATGVTAVSIFSLSIGVRTCPAVRALECRSLSQPPARQRLMEHSAH